MKSAATKTRGKQPPRHRRTQSAPLTRLVVLDAVRTWVIPTIAAAAGFVIFVIYNIGLVEEAFAITSIGALALLVVLFYGLRSFTQEALSPVGVAIVIAVAVLWSLTAGYPFYRAINAGTPVFTAELKRDTSVTLPLEGKPGHYSIVLEGHFLPAEGRSNRTAKYSIAVGHDGSTDRLLEGTFSQEWLSQRVGAGRRSSLVPVMRQTVQVRDRLDDVEGRNLTLKLTDLSPGVRDAVTIRLYAEAVPQWLLIVLGVLTLLGAVQLDAWRPKGENEGLLTTLTVATFVAVAVFRISSAAAPGFPQLAIAALVGTLVGAVGGSMLWRLTQPFKKYLLAQP